MQVVCDCLQIDHSYTKTATYLKNPVGFNDQRILVNARKEMPLNLKAYTQVFSQKYGFISNLSILDLVFNEGTNALTYLEHV